MEAWESGERGIVEILADWAAQRLDEIGEEECTHGRKNGEF